MILHTVLPSVQQYVLDALGTRWFLDFGSNVSSVTGHTKVIGILDTPGLSAQQIQSIAQQRPGSVWYVLGEPNRKISAAAAVEPAHALYAAIKAADPTAWITSPSILNWDFTCTGCGGYTPGHVWMDQFLAAYRARYGEEPPWDIWTLDAYPLDWNNVPTVNAQIPIAQITGLWAYKSQLPAHASRPIWVTEVSLHWGYTGFQIVGDNIIPTGTYQTCRVKQYLREMYDWLTDNAESKNIRRWFTFVTYANLATPGAGDAFAGMSLFDGPNVGANLSEVGVYFKARVGGQSPSLPACS